MNRFRKAGIIVAMVMALHASAAVLCAQADGNVAEHEESWLKWAVAAGLGVIVCITGFISAKRSHLT